MKISNNELKIITEVAASLAVKYQFGYYNKDDIEQEAILIGIEKLPKYKPESGTLKTFMYTAIGNGLKNFKRNKYHRLISKHCSDRNCKGSKTCEKCYQREQYINRKKNIMSPSDIEEAKNVEDTFHSNALEELELQETLSIIDEKLPIEMRLDYLKMKDSIKIPKSKRLAIEAKIVEILEEYYESE